MVIGLIPTKKSMLNSLVQISGQRGKAQQNKQYENLEHYAIVFL
jgi:hypothetical protein